MFYCSLIIFLGLHKRAQKFLLYLGRIPSAVGYQPTLATDLGETLQERITTTNS